MSQIAKDFRISESCLHSWVKRAPRSKTMFARGSRSPKRPRSASCESATVCSSRRNALMVGEKPEIDRLLTRFSLVARFDSCSLGSSPERPHRSPSNIPSLIGGSTEDQARNQGSGGSVRCPYRAS